MNKDQVFSLIRSLLKVIGAALAAHGATKVAAIVNAEDVIGVVLAIAGVVLSHVTHKDDTTTPADTSPIHGLMLAALLPALLLGSGCHTPKLEPGGAYAVAGQQAEPELYVADGAYKIAYETIDGILKFERENRAQIAAVAPGVKAALDQIRPIVWDVDQRWARARQAYRANPTPANLATVQSILSEAQRLSQAAQAASAPAYHPTHN